MFKVGLILTLLGIIMLTIGLVISFIPSEKVKTEYAGIIAIGPLIIPFGNRRELVVASLIIAIVIVLLTWIYLNNLFR